jgi:hypothetical protein
MNMPCCAALHIQTIRFDVMRICAGNFSVGRLIEFLTALG